MASFKVTTILVLISVCWLVLAAAKSTQDPDLMSMVHDPEVRPVFFFCFLFFVFFWIFSLDDWMIGVWSWLMMWGLICGRLLSDRWVPWTTVRWRRPCWTTSSPSRSWLVFAPTAILTIWFRNDLIGSSALSTPSPASANDWAANLWIQLQSIRWFLLSVLDLLMSPFIKYTAYNVRLSLFTARWKQAISQTCYDQH